MKKVMKIVGKGFLGIVGIFTAFALYCSAKDRIHVAKFNKENYGTYSYPTAEERSNALLARGIISK